MTSPVLALQAAAAAVGESWARALPPFGAVDGDASVEVGQFTDAGLLAVVEAVGALTRRTEALGAVVAAEVARRSPAGSRTGNLARTAGHSSPGRLVAASRGGQVGRAVELVKVGQGIAAGRSPAGDAMPAPHPHVAAGLHAGSISVDAAHLIITMLDRVSGVASPAAVDAAEQSLTAQAARLPLHQLVRVVAVEEARLNPIGMASREEDQRAARSFVMKQDSQGMFQVRGVLDPLTGAPIKTALDAYVTARLRETRGHNHPEGGDSATADDASVETRSIPQLQADALADFARHVLACDVTVPVVPAVTMVVRMDLADLRGDDGGAGFATIDGVDHPISAGAARRLACDAGLIPAVFDGASVPLDLGRRSRTFSRAQVLALWERDGGCAFCGQATFVEAHHIRWWYRDRGTTDLSNAVLLCSRCHHLIHRDGWGVTVGDVGEVTFTPPSEVDAGRVPRPAAPNPRRRGAPPSVPSARPPDRPPGRPDPTGPPVTMSHGWRIRRFAWRDRPTAETLRALLE